MRNVAEYDLPYFDNETEEVKIQKILISFISLRHMEEADRIRDAIILVDDCFNQVSDLITKIAISKEKGEKEKIKEYSDKIIELEEKIKTKSNIPDLRTNLIIDILRKNKAFNPESNIDDKLLDKDFWETNFDWQFHNQFLFKIIKKDIGKKKVIEK